MARPPQIDPKGASQRQLRVAENIRRAISTILQRGETHDPELDGMSVTVSEVQVSPDLRHARVFVLPLGGQDCERLLDALDRNRPELRRLVARNVNLKYSPDLRFFRDNSFDRMDETLRLLGKDEVRRDLD